MRNNPKSLFFTSLIIYNSGIDINHPINKLKKNDSIYDYLFADGIYPCRVCIERSILNEFKFRLGLMQEHFNENYLESNKYPKSTFEGTIENYENIELIDSFEEVSINGVLTIKGVSNSILAKGYIKKIGDKIELKSSFSVKLSDYNVKIPRIVFKKIDEEVKIKLNYSYAKKE